MLLAALLARWAADFVRAATEDAACVTVQHTTSKHQHNRRKTHSAVDGIIALRTTHELAADSTEVGWLYE